jgi:hypothetical protein
MNLGSVVKTRSICHIANGRERFQTVPYKEQEAGAFFRHLSCQYLLEAHGLPWCLISHRIGAHPGSMLLFFRYLCSRNEGTLTLFPP